MFHKDEIPGKILLGERIYTSVELRNEINRIKGVLSATRTMREKPLIALALPRTIHLIAAIFASLESHITFLPLDMKQPKDRIDYMLDLAEVNYIVTLSENTYDFGHRAVICLDRINMVYDDYDFIEDESNDVAYVLYTSGSTGRPKAVEVTRTGFDNFLTVIPLLIDFHKESVMACFTNCTFDIFFLESVLSLYQGLTIVLADEEEQNNPRKMAMLIYKHQVDMLQMTPSRFKMLMIADPSLNCLTNVKTIMLGGEPLPYDLLKLLQNKTKAKIFNMYGPTEATVWCCVSDLTIQDRVDIGEPIPGIRIYLLNDNLEPVPEGESGEICIGGLGLGKGYLNNEEQTEKSFIKLSVEPYERIYRSGDLGRYEEGRLIYLGRIDEQIKLRGHRIELEDIDSNVMKIGNVKASVTCYDQEAERLISFFVAGEKLEEANLRKGLEDLLPQYMIPARFIQVDGYYYTTSGKTDRKAILKRWKEKQTELPSETTVGGSLDTLTDIVIKITKGVMQDESLMVWEDSMLEDIGMDSISYMNMIIHIESVFHLEVEEEKLSIARFEGIRDITEYLRLHIAS